MQAATCLEDSTIASTIDVSLSVPASKQQWPQVRQVLSKYIEDEESMFYY